MRIRIHSDARARYVKEHSARGGWQQVCTVNWEWALQLDRIEGQWLRVETKIIFADQYNTSRIPGVSKQGMRIMGSSVAEVDYEGDARLEEMHRQMNPPSRRDPEHPHRPFRKPRVCHSVRYDEGLVVDPIIDGVHHDLLPIDEVFVLPDGGTPCHQHATP